MRFASVDAQGVLAGSFDHHWVADLYYDGERQLRDVPLSDVRFSEDADATVQQSGSCRIVWADEFGSSASPREIDDWFAPFGARLYVYSIVSAGDFSERVEFGRFDITDVPSARDEHMVFRGQVITTGSTVELTLKERLAQLNAETFDAPTAPSSLDSVWEEIGRITGLPLEQTVADAEIPRSIMYEDNKLDAVYHLMDVVLDAQPHMTADGALAARPNLIGDPVDTLYRGDGGSVVDFGSEMSAARVYNRVVVRGTADDQSQQILAVAEVTSGPLRVRNADGSRSPYGERTLYQSSEFVTTAEQAQAWADSTLENVSQLRARRLPVTETFNPLRERGDVVVVERANEWITGRVVTIERSAKATQQLVIEMSSSVPNTVPDEVPWVVPSGFPAYPASDVYPAADLFPVEA